MLICLCYVGKLFRIYVRDTILPMFLTFLGYLPIFAGLGNEDHNLDAPSFTNEFLPNFTFFVNVEKEIYHIDIFI